MKAHYFILSFLLIYCSCTKPNYYQLRINDIPTTAPNHNAEIRFAKDDLPKNPYFEIIDFNIIEKGNLSKQEIKRKLEIEAIKEGVDAIIGVDYWHDSNEEISLFTVLIDVLDDDNEPTTTSAHYTHIQGRGIMYLDNLDFINSQPEFEYFYQLDLKSDFPTPFFKMEYKLTGQVYMVYPESDEGLETYKNNFQYYSDFHLLKQREGWSYKMDGANLRKRVFRNENGFVKKVCVPIYDEEQRMVKLKIMHQNSQIDQNEFIYYAYDKQDKLTNRIIEMYNGTKIYEDYMYENSRLSGRKVIVNTSGQKKLKLKSSITYYDPNYLKDYYFKELAKKKKQ